MVPRLAQVVGEFDTVVDPMDQLRSAVCRIRRVFGQKVLELRRLRWQREPDMLCEATNRPRRDTQVVHRLRHITSLSSVLARVLEYILLALARWVDLARN